MTDKPDSLDQIRLLPDEKPKSCFWGHDWSNWEDKASGSITVENKTVGRFIYQERRCSRCNKVRLQKIQTEY